MTGDGGADRPPPGAADRPPPAPHTGRRPTLPTGRRRGRPCHPDNRLPGAAAARTAVPRARWDRRARWPRWARWSRGAGGVGSARRAGGRQLPPKQAIWAIAILAAVYLLARTGKVTSVDIILFCVIVPSIILHEISHGWVALAFGDDTAKRAGRLTLNPVAHIDPVGTLWSGPHGAQRAGHVRLGQAGAGQPEPAAQPPQQRRAGVAWPGRPPTWPWPRWPVGAFRLSAGPAPSLNGQLGIAVGRGGLLPRPGQHLAGRLQHDPDPAARRLGALRAHAAPGLVARLPAAAPVLACRCSSVLMLLSFYLHPGPLGWLFTHVFTWWAHAARRLSGAGVSRPSSPMASAARA